MSNEERQAALTLWLEERHITMQAIADAMGVSRPFVRTMLLRRETIPLKRHKQLLALGLPEELLPPPYTGPLGRPCSPPLLPALREQQSLTVS